MTRITFNPDSLNHHVITYLRLQIMSEIRTKNHERFVIQSRTTSINLFIAGGVYRFFCDWSKLKAFLMFYCFIFVIHTPLPSCFHSSHYEKLHL